MVDARRCVSLLLPVLLMCGGDARAEVEVISGRITLGPDLSLDAGDRLVLKLFHPDGGVEKDTRYWIIDSFDLPRDFAIAPSVDMNGRARWQAYMLEVFTDRDGDVLNAVPGELWARTETMVPLGTRGLELQLADPDP